MLVYNSKSNIFKKFRKKNKYESLGPKMLRDYINNRNYIEKKDVEKNKKEISRKIKRKNTNIRN